MNGAEALIETLSQAGVDVCFANPGTSEMQLVAAIDSHPTMRGVLGLFEGVVTGAADGYGRMADKPAATLLHLGPGLANGLANMHNARRAHAPMVNVVGDHATYHLALDAPLTSDIVGVATPMSDWVRTSVSPQDLADAGSEAVAAALGYPGQIATLISPANHAWSEGARPAAPIAPPPIPRASDEALASAVAALRGTGRRALFLGGRALRAEALDMAGRIAQATGAKLVCETFPARLQRGAGRVTPDRLPYYGEMASAALADFEAIVFVGTKPPVAFFAYPDKPGELSPGGADLVRLATVEQDALDALTRLAAELDAGDREPARQPAALPAMPDDGKLDGQSIGAILANLMPDNAIVSDEGATLGFAVYPMTQGAPSHDWMVVTGGAIGQGLPLATGAAIACPDRKVIALQADGGGMYTLQALWTMAREKLDVTTVLLNNSSYAILNIELARIGVTQPGPKAKAMLSLADPDIRWADLARGMGVPAVRCETNVEFQTALTEALAHKGPRLIEAVVPSG